MRKQRSTIVGFAILVILMTAGAAQSLSGTNTVFSDDIVDAAVTNADLGTNSVSRAKIQDNAIAGSEVINNSIAGADVNESSLVLACPSGLTRAGGLCFGSQKDPARLVTAMIQCAEEGLRLPSFSEAFVMGRVIPDSTRLWTDAYYVQDGVGGFGVALHDGDSLSLQVSASSDTAYRCVTTVGARP